MKKFIYLCMLLSMVGCTNVTTELTDIFEKVQNNNTEVVPELKTQKIILTTYSPEGILNNISTRLKNKNIREYDKRYGKNYELYVGDYVAIPLEIGENTYNLINYPKGIQYDIFIENGKLYFRSLYQGNYEIAIFSANGNERRILIKNKLNYEFTEQNNYDIISQSYNSNNLKALNDAIAIHRIAFPDSFRDKELSFLLIDLAAKNEDTKIIKDEIKFLTNTNLLNEYDKKQLLGSLDLLKDTSFEVPEVFLDYDSQTLGLNTQVGRLLIEKKMLSNNEIIFLEKLYNNITDNKEIGKVIGNWYIQNGDTTKGKEYLEKSQTGLSAFLGSFGLPTSILSGNNSPQVSQTPEEENYSQFKNLITEGKNSFSNENYVEALMYFDKALTKNQNYSEEKDIYFYIGKSYFNNGDYSKAITSLKKSLTLEKNDEKKAEIYYNIAMSYDHLGDKEQAENYFTYIIQNYKNSTWSVKSKLHLLNQ